MDDTIVGVSTALGVGAISIIRISGKDSLKIINKIFSKKIDVLDDHKIIYGNIILKKQIIDEVMISFYKAPKSYTTEDTIEINCHGGIAMTNKILEIVLNQKARLAEPGEFTKRAFLNGRINLLEAEAVMDIINSKNEITRKMAINQLNGKTTKLVKNLKEKILNILANIEVNIDYPEYEDALIYTNELLEKNIYDIKQEVQKILIEAQNGKIIKDGINILIIGRPNVGKSSILNTFLEEEKAIVTDIAGTTRDIVEGSINLNGLCLNFIDTAGIRKTKDLIEKKGIEKSLALAKDADLILYIIDNNENITNEDLNILNLLIDKQIIVVINKVDNKRKINIEKLKNHDIVETTTKKENGLDNLKKKILEKFNFEKIETKDLTYLSNARSINILIQIEKKIKDIEKSLKKQVPIDMIEIDCKKIFDLLGNLIGESYDDELIDKLFTNFCLGK